MKKADRQLPAALALVDRAEALSANNPNVLLLRAVVLGRQGDTTLALAALEQVAAAKCALGPAELLEKGRLLDRMGLYEEAFAAFDAGKERLRAITAQRYLESNAQAQVQRLASLPRARQRTDVAQPLFVLGFPRSGTTLLEQSLSAHPRIAAGDELPFIHEIAELMPRLLESPLGYPEALAEL